MVDWQLKGDGHQSSKEKIEACIRPLKARQAGYGPQQPWGVGFYKPHGLAEDEWRRRVAEKAEREWRERVAKGLHRWPPGGRKDKLLQSPASDPWFAEIGGVSSAP
jgi:hypothetical protein